VKLFLIKRGLSIRIQEFRVSLLVWIYLFHVSLLSSINPKYLTVSDVEIGTLLRVILGFTPCLSGNVLCIDLFWFILTHHFSYYSHMRLRYICKFDEAIKKSSFFSKRIRIFEPITNGQSKYMTITNLNLANNNRRLFE